MAIQLPTLVGTNCIYVQACSELKGTSGKAAPQETIVARNRRKEGVQYLRLLQTGKPVSHVHVDLAQKAYFGNLSPHVSHKMIDFSKSLAAYAGSETKLYFRARYVTPAVSLPQSGLILAGQNKVLTKFEGANVELSGAVLKLSNATVDWIEWKVTGDTVSVDISFWRPASISASYISDSLETTNEAFNTFVLGKATATRP